MLTLGNLWSSEPLKSYVYSLEGKQATANAGNKVGNKLFFANDYMVSATTLENDKTSDDKLRFTAVPTTFRL